jgi:ketol-acid reductoisomerase
MTKIYREADADVAALAGQTIAVVGYGNQGRSWALNLRDSGLDPQVCVRADTSREQARADGFAVAEVTDASAADVVCVLIPDDVIPTVGIERRPDSLTIVASGYTPAFNRFDPPGDVGMVAPRMLGPEVRRCYQEQIGFITAVGIHRDATGTALARTLAIAKAIGGLRQGAIELSLRQEAILDLAVEQVLAPALTLVNGAFLNTLLEHDIPIEAILTELFLSGEVERTYRLLREIGFAQQLEFHSPTSQYGQLSRRGSYDQLDFMPRMRALVDDIASGRFADEWDAEMHAGYPRLRALKEQHAGEFVRAFEADLRARLGPRSGATTKEP